MREILFRGKTDKNDNWVYGSLNNTDHQFPEIMYCDKNWNVCSTSIKPETIGQYTGLTDKNDTKIFEGDIVKVYAERNVHGRKQSVEDRYIPVRAVVEFGQDWYSVGFILNYKNKYNENLCNPKNKEKQKRTFSYYPFGDYSSAVHYVNSKWNYIHEIEVIGNIHDNPELLEEDK